MNIWTILNSFKDKNIIDEKIVKENLNINVLLVFLMQNNKTIDIALYIVKNLLKNDIYTIYLYVLSKYPIGLNHTYIKNNKEKEKNINLLLELFNTNNNEVINMLKSMNNITINELNTEKDLLIINKILLNDMDKENHFLSLI